MLDKWLWRAICAMFTALSIYMLGFGAAKTEAQSTQISQISQAIDTSALITLRGNVHPLATARYDRGPAPRDLAAGRMLLVLRRSVDQESNLKEFLDSVYDRKSQNYHRFVTPVEFESRYGPSDGDVKTVIAWLESNGFTVNRVLKGKSAVEFSGSVGQVEDTFHTPIHHYVVQGKDHWANAREPQIPSALARVVAGVARLNNFQAHPLNRVLGQAQIDATSHRAVPLFNDPVSGGLGYYLPLVPGDVNTIYDLKPLLQAGVNGSGVSIAVVGDSNIDTAIVDRYRGTFGLPASTPTVIIDGADPGVNGDATEAYLDVELAGAVAPNASIKLYAASDTSLASGLDIAALRAVTDNSAAVLSISYGACEQELGATENEFLNSLFEEAAAQGITVVVAAGDAGSAGCDNSSFESSAANGLAVNGYASTPYSVTVGGTDFFYSDPSGPLNGTYWNQEGTPGPNNNSDFSSALQYIPEMPWNDSNPTLNQFTASGDISGGGGGKSSCSQTNSSGSCSGGYQKPAWQVGSGVPNDGVRDLPDVSLFGGDGLNYSFYAICAASTDCPAGADPNSLNSPLTVTAIGGTSAAAPAFAGIMALAVQKYGLLGQVNYVLYPLAAQHPAAFHDIAIGDNAVQCQLGTPDCNATGYLTGYTAATGYDQASGLGSVDASQLLNNWNAISFASTGTSLTASPTSFAHGTTVTLGTQVSASNGGTPSGQVAILSNASVQSLIGYVNLTNGTGTLQTSMLPGGNYQIYARYSGDGVYGSSTSAQLSLSVSPEASLITILDEAGLSSTGTAVSNLSNETLSDGSTVSFEVVVTPASGASGSTLAQGTVTVSDNGSAVSTLSLNAGGIATFSSNTLAPGSHSIVLSFSGDASYSPSSTSATPLTFVVSQSATAAIVPNVVVDAQTILASGFNQPQGIVVTPNGAIYVADALNNRIATIANGIVTPVPISGFSLNRPSAIACDLQGNLFIADTNNARVIEIPASGSPSIVVGSTILQSPISLAIDSNGNLYVGDGQTRSVYELPSTGGAATQISTTGATNLIPTALTTDTARNLYIGDDTSGAIYEVPAGGGVAQNVTPSNMGLLQPKGLGFDLKGNLYILDAAAEHIIEVPAADPADPYLVPIQGLIGPNGLATDTRGNVYVTDATADTVTQLLYNGNAVELGSSPVGALGTTNVMLNYELNAPTNVSSFQSVSLGDPGNEVVTGTTSTCQAKNYSYNPVSSRTPITPANPFVCTVAAIPNPLAPGLRQTAFQMLGTSGTVLASIPVNEIGLAAAPLAYPLSVQQEFTGLKWVSAFAVSGLDQTIYVAEAYTTHTTGLVYKWNPNVSQTLTPLNTGAITLWAPYGLALDSSGNLYIADSGDCANSYGPAEPGKIVVVPPGTGEQPYVLNTGTLLAHPAAVTVDRQGNLFVGDGGADVCTANGSITDFYVKFPVGGGTPTVLSTSPLTVYFPDALIMDPAGDLYIADSGPDNLNDGSGQVVIIPANGGSASRVNIPGLVQPAGISIDAAGQLYVADTFAPNQITVVPPGTGTEPYVMPVSSNNLNYMLAMAPLSNGQGFLIGDASGTFPLSSVDVVYGYKTGLTFPATAVGSQSSPLVSTLVNVGNLPLTLGNPDYNASGQSAVFPIQSTSTCANGLILDPAVSCGVEAAFTPTTSGSFSSTLTFTTNGFVPLGAPSVTLTGTAQ